MCNGILDHYSLILKKVKGSIMSDDVGTCNTPGCVKGLYTVYTVVMIHKRWLLIPCLTAGIDIVGQWHLLTLVFFKC